MEVDVELRCLTESGLNAANLGNLRANVEVNKAQAVVQTLFVEYLQSLEELHGCESELRGISSTLFPFSRPRRSQLDTDAEIGLHPQLTGRFGNELQLIELLHDNEDMLSHLLCQQGQLNVALVLVAIADDE